MTAVELRQLVSCPRCAAQYDASDLAPGARLRCSCGEAISVPEPRAHEAAVVRCSSCGAPRVDGAPCCSFCGSSFTLHERDLHTICPGCLARISDRARFCHSCGVGIAPQAAAGERTELACPACGAEQHLRSRRLDDRLALLECDACAGLWLSAEIFAHLASSAEEVRAAVAALGAGGTEPAKPHIAKIDRHARLYRPCPSCGEMMHRRNYGRKSGVIVDTCRAHGVWFDDGELARILSWLRSGGGQRAAREEDFERRQIARHEALYGPRAEPAPLQRDGRSMRDLVGPVVDFLSYFV